MEGASGLPPLPKSLSGFLNLNRGESPAAISSASSSSGYRSGLSTIDFHSTSPFRPIQSPGGPSAFHNVVNSPVRPVPEQTRQDQFYANVRSSPAEADRSRSSRDEADRMRAARESPSGWGMQRPKGSTSLDAQLARLRKEMVSLRQVDMNLLVQLWQMNQQIEELKSHVHKAISPTAEEDWEEDSGADSDEFYSQPVSTYSGGPRGSESSSGGKRSSRMHHAYLEHQYSSESTSSTDREFRDIQRNSGNVKRSHI